MEEIILQRKLEALGQNGTLIRKDGKTFLQLDCENAKELSMKWGEKLYPFTKTGKKWILELPFSTAVNYVQILSLIHIQMCIRDRDNIEATLHLISDDLQMAELWAQFQKSNFYVGDLAWKNVIGYVENTMKEYLL